MQIETKIYLLKQEFFKILKIDHHQWDRRREDLLDWLNDFYDYEILQGRPLRINVK